MRIINHDKIKYAINSTKELINGFCEGAIKTYNRLVLEEVEDPKTTVSIDTDEEVEFIYNLLNENLKVGKLSKKSIERVINAEAIYLDSKGLLDPPIDKTDPNWVKDYIN